MQAQAIEAADMYVYELQLLDRAIIRCDHSLAHTCIQVVQHVPYCRLVLTLCGVMIMTQETMQH